MGTQHFVILAVLVAVALEKAHAQNQCRGTVVTSGNGVLSADQIMVIVDEHNVQRRRVNPYANDMPMIQWNAALATYAQQLVDTCPTADATPVDQLTNKQGVTLLGENYVRGDANSYGLDGGAGGHAMLDWTRQSSYWSYPTTCEAGHDCRAYMQVIDASVTEFGCGYKQCGSSGPRHLWRCLYNHAQSATASPFATGGTPNACQEGNIPQPPDSTASPSGGSTPAPAPTQSACDVLAEATTAKELTACIIAAGQNATQLNGKPMCSLASIAAAQCANTFVLAEQVRCPEAARKAQQYALGRETCTNPNSQGAQNTMAFCAEGQQGLELLCAATNVPVSAGSTLAASIAGAILVALFTLSF